MPTGEAENEEAYEVISDSEEYEVFYDQDQIKATRIQQNADLFDGIVSQQKKV